MLEWYEKKLGEFIQVARYCHHPSIEAHLELTREAAQEYLGEAPQSSEAALERIIRLSAEQAQRDGRPETASHLFEALESLLREKPASAEIIQLDLRKLERDSA